MSQVLDLSCMIPCQGTSTTAALTVFGGEKKNMFLWGSFSLASPLHRHTALILAPCHPIHNCSAVTTHVLLLPHNLLLLPLVPPLRIPTPEKQARALHHHHLTLTPDEEGLSLVANISRGGLLQRKPHKELTTAVMAEFKFSNDLNRGNGVPM